jgi:hypothetical protein
LQYSSGDAFRGIPVTNGFEEDLVDLRKEVAEFVLGAIANDPNGDVAQRLQQALADIVPPVVRNEIRNVADGDRTLLRDSLVEIRKLFSEEQQKNRLAIETSTRELQDARAQQTKDAQIERKDLGDSVKDLQTKLVALTDTLGRMEEFLRKQTGMGDPIKYPGKGVWGLLNRKPLPVWALILLAAVLPAVSIIGANLVTESLYQRAVLTTADKSRVPGTIPLPPPAASGEPLVKDESSRKSLRELQARLAIAPSQSDVIAAYAEACPNGPSGLCKSFREWYGEKPPAHAHTWLRAAYTVLSPGMTCPVPAKAARADAAGEEADNRSWTCLLIAGRPPFQHFATPKFVPNIASNDAHFEERWKTLLKTLPYWPTDDDSNAAMGVLCGSADCAAPLAQPPDLMTETPTIDEAVSYFLSVGTSACASRLRGDARRLSGGWGQDLRRVWSCILKGDVGQ